MIFLKLKLQKYFNIISIRFYHKKIVRVRFAPSPTGYLHLGGLRTALYNYLFAKSFDGKFILRIEDTDQTRLVAGALEELQNDLSWAGLKIDEGPNIGGGNGPYVQSHRLHIYREQVKKLLQNNTAYYCFCTDRRLNLLRKEALKSNLIPRYDNKCRHLTSDELKEKLRRGEPYCIRFKLKSGIESFNDLVYGKTSYDVSLNEGDPVIMKSDGYPTYHFANVVDDQFMQISHVLRGVEWQISTTKHIMLYKAFGWQPPVYGHLPLLLNSDGTKLSKRQGDIKICYYREKGIFPLALVNFISHSGGGFAKDLETGIKPKIYTLDELAQQFNVKNINVHSGKLMQERLLEFNKLELIRQVEHDNNLDALAIKLQELIRQKFRDRVDKEDLHLDIDYIKSVLRWCTKRINTLEDLLAKELAFLWVRPSNKSSKVNEEVMLIEKFKHALEEENFDKDALRQFLRKFAENSSTSFPKFMKLVRGILSGLEEGPGVAEMIETLGKENTLIRLNNYIKNK